MWWLESNGHVSSNNVKLEVMVLWMTISGPKGVTSTSIGSVVGGDPLACKFDRSVYRCEQMIDWHAMSTWDEAAGHLLRTWALVGHVESQWLHFALHWMFHLCKFISIGNVSETACRRRDNWPGWKPDNCWFQVLQEVSSSAESENLDWAESDWRWSSQVDLM